VNSDRAKSDAYNFLVPDRLAACVELCEMHSVFVAIGRIICESSGTGSWGTVGVTGRTGPNRGLSAGQGPPRRKGEKGVTGQNASSQWGLGINLLVPWFWKTFEETTKRVDYTFCFQIRQTKIFSAIYFRPLTAGKPKDHRYQEPHQCRRWS